MKLIYLSEANLKDRLLIRDLVFNLKIKEKAILVHDSFGGTIRDTRFVTKRLSSLFSEAMVYNNAFSGDQRALCKRNEEGKLKLDTDRILKLVAPIQLIILGPIVEENGTSALVSGEEMMEAVREQMEFSELFLFPANGLSPLGNKARVIEGKNEYEELLKVFEEEKDTLERAFVHAPARIISPKYLNPQA